MSKGVNNSYGSYKQLKSEGLGFQYNAPVILTYTLIAFIVLLLAVVTSHKTTEMFFSAYFTSFSDPLLYVRLFAHVLGHANWGHFFNNFLLILLIGPMLEEKYGSITLLKMLLITAFITGLLNVVFFDTALLGASGILFMLVMLSSFANMKAGRIPLTLVIVIVFFIGREIFAGVSSQDNISQLTHVVGGLCGGMFGFLIGERKT
jgi:membrane associated rhomboid family serine protease